MSIFEPIPRESRWDEDAQELDEARWDDGAAPTAGFDPRSITIAGFVVVAIVIAGLVASNAADPASRPQPLVPARVNPGAAAVEQVEAKQSAPDPSDSPSVESKDEGDNDAPSRQAPNGSSDDFASSGHSKWDSKPGKGHGHGRG